MNTVHYFCSCIINISLIISIANAQSIRPQLTNTSSTAVGIFILAGQSNASGRGELNASTETPDSRVIMFGNDYLWKTAYEPVDDPTNQIDTVSSDNSVITPTKGHSFALKAAKDLVTTSIQSAILIPCPRGGTKISQWRKPVDPFDRTTLFGSCNYRQSTAAPGGINAMWWYQGESNQSTPGTFITENTQLMNEFRSEMGANLPIIYVQLAKQTTITSNSAQHHLGELQRLMETGSGDTSSISNHFMVVAFDLPLIDNVHINQTAQKELGRRIALSTREHVYGESIDGTGPRLITSRPLIHPNGDKSTIKVQLSQSVNTAVNRYDNQFRVYDTNTEISIANVFRDTSDNSAVIISMITAASGVVTVSYGEVTPSGLGKWYTNVIKGANELPLPRFGPLTVYNPKDIIIDNSDPEFSIISGTWGTNNLAGGYGANYRYHITTTANDIVRWTPDIFTPGYYRVSIWYSASTNRANNVPITINAQSGSTTILINQRINGSQWFNLGNFAFDAGTTGYIELSDNAEFGKYVIADAVRLTYINPIAVSLVDFNSK
ncbi:MAG: sialate O-acetylesterase [bacterium]